ncbi:MAG TPA: hypothetical protein PKN44_09075 [Bacteroidales bacterium]|mgnify:CR=1 FL=1|nr:hypothetical protein [Bacteroidales bacterium]
MKNKSSMESSIRYGILFAIVLISIVCRLIATADSHLIPGLGSMYYPLQVRCLLERGTLGYSDVPLVFWIEALAARIIILVSSMPVSDSIVFACRLVNAIVPSLIVIPVFYLTLSVSKSKIHPAYLVVILALSVLNPSVLVLFAIDFDKNAISMLFVYMTLYYLWQFSNHRKTKELVMIAGSVILTLLTHFGCFSSLFIFLLVFTFVTGFFSISKIIKWFHESGIRIVFVTFSLLVFILLPFLLKLYDNQRFLHLISYFSDPLQIFRNSFFMLIYQGKLIWDWQNLLYLIIINSFSIMSIILFFRIRKRMGKEQTIFYLSLVIWFVLLSNPFINTAIYNRLLFISLIPLTVITIFIFQYCRKPVRIPIAIVLALLLTLTVATSGVRRTYISKEEYLELSSLRTIIPKPSSTIVLAQHRLEFWTSWTLRIKSGQLSGIKPYEYPKYSQVLYVVQKSNQVQEEIPKSASLIHTGRYFDLYKIY